MHDPIDLFIVGCWCFSFGAFLFGDNNEKAPALGAALALCTVIAMFKYAPSMRVRRPALVTPDAHLYVNRRQPSLVQFSIPGTPNEECRFLIVSLGRPVFGIFRLRDLCAYRTNGTYLHLFMRDGNSFSIGSMQLNGQVTTLECIDAILRYSAAYVGREPYRVPEDATARLVDNSWVFSSVIKI
jgi:hypothetical protein